MAIKSDYWIEKMALEHGMIDPFEANQVREDKISYGLSSFGYDIRVSDSGQNYCPYNFYMKMFSRLEKMKTCKTLSKAYLHHILCIFY